MSKIACVNNERARFRRRRRQAVKTETLLGIAATVAERDASLKVSVYKSKLAYFEWTFDQRHFEADGEAAEERIKADHDDACKRSSAFFDRSRMLTECFAHLPTTKTICKFRNISYKPQKERMLFEVFEQVPPTKSSRCLSNRRHFTAFARFHPRRSLHHQQTLARLLERAAEA